MRVVFIFIAAFFLLGSKSTEKRRWVIDSSSKLFIYGNSNVNSFTCSTDCFGRVDTLTFLPSENACDIFFTQTQISVPVKSFSCGSELITKDFWDAVDAEKYPMLTVHFLNLKKFTSAPNGGSVQGEVAIVLANVKRKYNVEYTINRQSKDYFSLKGRQEVCFSDFQLKPPRKMMGLIQVEEGLEVEFLMNLKAID